MNTTNVYTLEEIKLISSSIAKRFGLNRVWVFGSYAKNEATCNSDIDILVCTEDVIGGFKLLDVKFAFEDAFCKYVDIVTTGSLKGSLLEGLDLQEVLIFSKN